MDDFIKKILIHRIFTTLLIEAKVLHEKLDSHFRNFFTNNNLLPSDHSLSLLSFFD